MRIHIRTSPNTEPITFDYQQKLVGTVHKWIGPNNIHDNISLYSFSWLMGADVLENTLEFKDGATFFISFYDENIVKGIIRSILNDPMMFGGLTVTDMQVDGNPDFSNRETFYCASPIFIKRRLADGKTKQFSYNDANSGKYLRETLVSKMRKAGLEEDESLEIEFDLSYVKKRQKLIRYHGIGNKANLCPVIIKGKNETKLFAWNVGIGNNTGIGFGAIY